MFARAIDGGDDAVRARDARETRDRETRARDADRVAPPMSSFSETNEMGDDDDDDDDEERDDASRVD